MKINPVRASFISSCRVSVGVCDASEHLKHTGWLCSPARPAAWRPAVPHKHIKSKHLSRHPGTQKKEKGRLLALTFVLHLYYSEDKCNKNTTLMFWSAFWPLGHLVFDILYRCNPVVVWAGKPWQTSFTNLILKSTAAGMYCVPLAAPPPPQGGRCHAELTDERTRHGDGLSVCLKDADQTWNISFQGMSKKSISFYLFPPQQLGGNT